MLKIYQVVDVLKHEAINEYNKMLNNLYKGKSPEYKFILDLISYINMGEPDENIKQYLLNATGFLHFRK